MGQPFGILRHIPMCEHQKREGPHRQMSIVQGIDHHRGRVWAVESLKAEDRDDPSWPRERSEEIPNRSLLGRGRLVQGRSRSPIGLVVR